MSEKSLFTRRRLENGFEHGLDKRTAYRGLPRSQTRRERSSMEEGLTKKRAWTKNWPGVGQVGEQVARNGQVEGPGAPSIAEATSPSTIREKSKGHKH